MISQERERRRENKSSDRKETHFRSDNIRCGDPLLM